MDQFYNVKCLNGTSKHPISGGALAYWRNATGITSPIMCCVSGCCNTAVDGAHVIISNSGRMKQYIVPMCHAHNMDTANIHLVYTTPIAVNP